LRAAWAVAAAGLLITAGAMAFVVANRDLDGPPGLTPSLPADLLWALAFSAFLVVGGMVAARRPGNPVGWLLLIEGVVWELGLFCAGYVGYSIGHSLPAPGLFAWVLSWIWAVGLAGVPLLLALFPDGLWPGRRWRLVGVGALTALALLFAGSAFVPGPMADVPGLENPVGIDGLEVLAAIGGVVLTATLVASLAAFALRLRRASPLERRQLKWVAVAVAAIAAGLLAAALLDVLGVPESVTSYFNTLPLAALPIGIGIAMLRHDLYDADRALKAALSVCGGLAAAAAVGAVAGSVPAALAGAVAALGLQRLHPRREEAPPAVEVRTLGGFKVLRHGEPLPASAWQSRKARTLLKILIARRGRPVTREALMEWLWPGEDPAKLSNRLSVALNTVRSVLGPEVLVQAESGALAVDLSVVEVDVERFLASPAELSLYRGDFLEEDLYEDWAADLRDEARAAYASAIRTRAADAAGDEAVRLYLRLLEVDRWDAEAHLALIAVLENSGRHGEAVRRRRVYEAAMEEIGARP
jgi:DNA-binding SARP family transcriptional activator